jgi:hypothetical protein
MLKFSLPFLLSETWLVQGHHHCLVLPAMY